MLTASAPMTAPPRRAGVVAVGLMVATVAAVAVVVHVPTPETARWLPVPLVAGLFVLYVAGGTAVQRAPQRLGVAAAVAGGALLQVVAASVPPRSTDDYLRYAWDGRVQAAGIDPYRYPPGAPELARLRDAWLFPDGSTPALNHPTDRTIYPPVAQLWFWLVHELSGGHGRGLPLQIGSAVLAVLTSLAVVAVLRRTGGDPRRVVWWAWCPTVVLEAGNGAHVDVLGALLVVLALGALSARRWVGGGVLLGLAVGAKLLPGLVAVGVPPRRSLRVGLAAVAAVAVVYAPHVAVLGTDVTGFLGGYVDEEARGRFRVLKALLPDVVVTPVALVLLTATALLLWRRAGRDEAAGLPPRPWHQAATMVGVTYVVLTPSYSWYALLLVPLVALGASRRWLWVVAAGYPVYFASSLPTGQAGTRALAYGLAAVLVALHPGGVVRRARLGGWSGAQRPARR